MILLSKKILTQPSPTLVTCPPPWWWTGWPGRTSQRSSAESQCDTKRISQVILTKLSQTNTKFRIIIQNYQITGKCSIWRGVYQKTMAASYYWLNYTLLKWKYFPLQKCWLVKSLDIRKWMERDTRRNPPAANTWVGRTEVWNHLASARHTTFIVNVIKRVLQHHGARLHSSLLRG